MYRYAKRRFGEVPEPFAVVGASHRGCWWPAPSTRRCWSAARRSCPSNVRELAVYWTARTVGCSWCVDFGAMLLRLDGLDVDRLKDIDDYATSPRYTDDERAAIAYADAMTTDPHNVTDEQVADSAAPVRRRGRHRADLPDRRREHAGPDEHRARHHRAGLQFGGRVPGALG